MVELTRWIEGRAGLSPDAVAVHFEGADVPFAELVGRGRRLAQALEQRFGVAKGDRVAHLGYNSVEYLDLLIACARLGAILLPLNWRLAPPELAYIIGHAEPKVLLAEEDFRAPLTEIGVDVDPRLGCLPDAAKRVARARRAVRSLPRAIHRRRGRRRRRHRG